MGADKKMTGSLDVVGSFWNSWNMRLIIFGCIILVYMIIYSRRKVLFREYAFTSWFGNATIIGSLLFIWLTFNISPMGWIFETQKYNFTQQIMLMLNYTHLGSLTTYFILYLALWHKNNKPIAAMVTTLACIATVEFVCIPQHLLFFGWIVLDMAGWYFSFTLMLMPIYASRLAFTWNREKFLVFFALATIALFIAGYLCQYCDFIKWDNEFRMFVARTPEEMPSGIMVWIYQLMQRLQKSLYCLSFYFVRLKK